MEWAAPPRSPKEFFAKFTPPKNGSKWTSRLKCNVYFYRTNRCAQRVHAYITKYYILTLGAGMVVRSLWACWSLPWTSQDKSGHLDTQDGRRCAYALGRGSPHRCLLTLHNLMGDAGINDELGKNRLK